MVTRDCHTSAAKLVGTTVLKYSTSQIFTHPTLGQNGRHFTDDIFNCMDEKFCIFIRISLKSVPKRPTDNKSAMVQGRRQDITWISATQFHDAYMGH